MHNVLNTGKHVFWRNPDGNLTVRVGRACVLTRRYAVLRKFICFSEREVGQDPFEFVSSKSR